MINGLITDNFEGGAKRLYFKGFIGFVIKEFYLLNPLSTCNEYCPNINKMV